MQHLRNHGIIGKNSVEITLLIALLPSFISAIATTIRFLKNIITIKAISSKIPNMIVRVSHNSLILARFSNCPFIILPVTGGGTLSLRYIYLFTLSTAPVNINAKMAKRDNQVIMPAIHLNRTIYTKLTIIAINRAITICFQVFNRSSKTWDANSSIEIAVMCSVELDNVSKAKGKPVSTKNWYEPDRSSCDGRQ
uniref:Putative secreted protein n=1 Tax=Panstrongylus lignarius TaxID=156445 RepID=A0A224XL34_9HEMI